MVDVSDENCQYCGPGKKETPENGLWVNCDICKSWSHYECVGESPESIAQISSYHCPKCREEHGPSEKRRASTRKRRNVDYIALDSGDVNVATTAHDRHVYIDLLESRDFDRTHLTITDPAKLSKEWVCEHGFTEPIKIPKEQYSSLGMVVPDDLTVRKVAELVGEDTPLEVMDVPTQGALSGWTVGKWRDYFESTPENRERARNVISLEVSDTTLGGKVTRPRFVRDMDLVARVWPQHLKDADDYPKVSLYCLMSVKDCYTDFHVDFGGSSVFYHVCQGSKTFLFIPPTDTNLTKYQKWCKDPEQNNIFFADLVKQCYRVDLQKGDSLMIPSGWIHAVYTPEDAVVIGGNFLTAVTMEMEAKIIEVEKQTKVPKKFTFPHFIRVMWFTVAEYMRLDDKSLLILPTKEKDSVICLAKFLLEHTSISGYRQAFKESFPELSKTSKPAAILETLRNRLDTKKHPMEESGTHEPLHKVTKLKSEEPEQI
uniref:JmjC domain-containing histone demethylation protein 1 n=1 Tax=Blastobotrys adeninivorans TaxID=409370 RepID=A0A060TFG1_BLAAD